MDDTIVTPPPPSPPSPPSDPLKPAKQTTEWSLTLIVGILGAVIAGLGTTAGMLKDVMPDSQAIVLLGSIVAGLGTVVAVVMKFMGGRTALKVAQVNGSAAVQAAQTGAAQSPPPRF